VVALAWGGRKPVSPARSSPPGSSGPRKAGYATVAHAGETAGAEHVRQAVLDLGVRRVQHGVRAAEDPSVLKLLAERGICCDVALTSNECLKVVASVLRPSAPCHDGGGSAGHPLDRRSPVLRNGPEPRVGAGGAGRRPEHGRGLGPEPERLALRPRGDGALRRKLLKEFEEAGRGWACRGHEAEDVLLSQEGTLETTAHSRLAVPRRPIRPPRPDIAVPARPALPAARERDLRRSGLRAGAAPLHFHRTAGSRDFFAAAERNSRSGAAAGLEEVRLVRQKWAGPAWSCRSGSAWLLGPRR